RRFAESQKCEVKAAKDGSDYVLTVTKSGPAAGSSLDPASMTCRPRAAAQPRLVVKISSRFMGSGPDELGRVLIKAFLKSLPEAACEPEAIVFYNSGVHLTCEGSEHLDALRALEDKGVQIISCGTCLDFLGIKDKLAVGLTSNMFEIIEVLTGADRVVSP
ncbi:MAG: sulfurtransferase-like selenium metabolism protein YedF, partial [Thermodesulfobacteriota bacterium]|nr:sulfurtransferase-like selenium metabolism protein YedF [Thermodesulfobacteriota bacterium]